jgi:hypothetical protein
MQHANWRMQGDREVVLGKLSLGHWRAWPEREREAVVTAVEAAF